MDQADGASPSRRRWLEHPFVVSVVGGIIVAIAAALITRLVADDDNDSVPQGRSATTVALAPETPLRFTLQSNDGAYGDGWSMVVPGVFPTTGWPPSSSSCSTVRRWVLENAGGVDAEKTFLKMTVEGLSGSTVSLNDIRARIVSKKPLITSTLVRCPSAGLAEGIGIGFDLDQAEPIARELNPDSGELGGSYFKSRFVTVAQGEVLRFDVTAHAIAATYEWAIEVDAVVDGRPQVFVVDDNGKPFTTAGLPHAPEQRWHWAWYESSPSFVDCRVASC